VKKVAILGAGISGLSLAWYLQKLSSNTLDITIFEKTSRVGGWIKSKKVENAIFECGPRSLRTKGSGTLIVELIEALDLQEQTLTASPSAKERYIVQNQALQKLPGSLFECLTSKWTPLFTAALMRDLVAGKKRTSGDESVYDFFSRRFGTRCTDTLIEPLTSGIWATHPKNLSMQCTFSSLAEKETAFRSLVLGVLLGKKNRGLKLSSWARSKQNTMLSFTEGIELLPETLAAKVQAKICLNEPVVSLSEKNNSVLVETKEGLQRFDALFSTLQSHHIAPLFAKTDPHVSLLNTMAQTSLVTVSFGYKGPIKIPSGFGFLCNSFEENELLGIVFDSNIFTEHNGCFSIRLSVMMGKTDALHLCAQEDESLRKKAEGFVKKYLKIDEPCTFCFVQKAQHAISCYNVGHKQKVEKVQNLLSGSRIWLLGTSMYGVSVGDCIASSKKVASEYWAWFKTGKRPVTK